MALDGWGTDQWEWWSEPSTFTGALIEDEPEEIKTMPTVQLHTIGRSYADVVMGNSFAALEDSNDVLEDDTVDEIEDEDVPQIPQVPVPEPALERTKGKPLKPVDAYSCHQSNCLCPEPQ